MIKDFDGNSPAISDGAFVAENASVIGKVTLSDGVSVWYGAVIRGDCAAIAIGENSNIQDNCILHADKGFDVTVGKNVTVGHNAVLHGCSVGDNCLIGMGAILLNGAVIGENSIVGAGALVTENKIFPPNSVIIGSPAKVSKTLEGEKKEDTLKSIAENAEHYLELAKMQL